MFLPTLSEVQHVMSRKNYKFFTSRDYNLNIIGIRSSRVVTNLFDDTILVLYKIYNRWQTFAFPCTTDPGRGPMETPPVKGRAVLAPGQYRSAYAVGKHKGTQEALVQVKPVTVYRDRNGDNVLDYINPDTGLFGINIHWSNLSRTSVRVDNWSEGCQVGTGPEYREQFLCMLSAARIQYGNHFTYTLLEEADFME